MDDISKCPVMHGSATNNKGVSTSNKDWWPNQLNINILHQNKTTKGQILWRLISIIVKNL